MGLLKKIAQRFVLPGMLQFKVDALLLNKTKKSCCIINFHGVRSVKHGVFNNRHLPVEEFEKTLVYLKSRYNIVPLSQIFELHRGKKKPGKKTIALTFDDGYKNNFDLALPLLKKHNIPATFFIITKGLAQDNYLCWADIIDIFKKHHKEPVKVNNYEFGPPSFYNTSLQLDLLNYLKTCGDLAESLAYKIAGSYNYQLEEIKKSPELTLLINGSEIEKYAHEPLLEIGSHTHTHYCLQYLDAETAKTELTLSRDMLERKIGKKIKSIAFPDGSYSKETLKIAAEAGYTDLAAVSYYFNENNSDPNLLSRFTISNSTTYQSNALRLAREFNQYGFN